MMIVFVLIVLLSRRLPFVVALQRGIPDIWTYKEALFAVISVLWASARSSSLWKLDPRLKQPLLPG
jgi:hypothetical protein